MEFKTISWKFQIIFIETPDNLIEIPDHYIEILDLFIESLTDPYVKDNTLNIRDSDATIRVDQWSFKK